MSEEALKAVESRDRVIDDLKAELERYKAAVGVAESAIEALLLYEDKLAGDHALATLRGLKG